MQPTLYDVFRAAIAEADLVNAASAILGDRWPGRVAEEARTVRLIYKLFISGLSVHRIAKYLTEHSIPTPGGGKAWYDSSVKSILTNEKYKGDALLQKEYVSDFLQKTRKKNDGEVAMYYVEKHHEGIITPE